MSVPKPTPEERAEFKRRELAEVTDLMYGLAHLEGSEAPLVTALREALYGAEDWALQKEWDRAYAVLRRGVKQALSGSAPQPPTSPWPSGDEAVKALAYQLQGQFGGLWEGWMARSRDILTALAASQEPSTGDDR